MPSRFSQLTALFAGLLLALFLHAVWGQGGWRRWAAAAVGLVVLAPLWPAGDVPTEPVATPAFFTGPAVRQLPRDSVALVLPFPNSTVALPITWQAQADLWFRMPGGYFIGPTPEGKPRFGVNPSQGSRVLNRIYRGLPPPRLSTAVWKFVRG